MKLPVLLAAMLVGASAIAQDAPAVFPMPSPFPAVPAGVNPAAYPVPVTYWFDRVRTNIASARKGGDSIQLIFDGDSITDGFRGREPWLQRYAKLGAIDFGIGGDSTQHVLWRLAQGQADGLHPKLIAILIGTNNGQKPDQIAEGIKAIVSEYQKRCPEAVILLQGLFPRGELPDNPGRAKIKAVNEIISKLGDGKKVIYMDLGDKFLSPDGTISKEIMGDFLHPTAKGYQIWADAIQPVIDKYVPAK